MGLLGLFPPSVDPESSNSISDLELHLSFLSVPLCLLWSLVIPHSPKGNCFLLLLSLNHSLLFFLYFCSRDFSSLCHDNVYPNNKTLSHLHGCTRATMRACVSLLCVWHLFTITCAHDFRDLCIHATLFQSSFILCSSFPAFEIAERKPGIPAWLEPEDMA